MHQLCTLIAIAMSGISRPHRPTRAGRGASGDGFDDRPDRGGTLGIGGRFAQSGSETLDQDRDAHRQLNESNRVPRQATTVSQVAANVEAHVASSHVDRIILQSPERSRREPAHRQCVRQGSAARGVRPKSFARQGAVSGADLLPCGGCGDR